jgi:hypothetical protein
MIIVKNFKYFEILICVLLICVRTTLDSFNHWLTVGLWGLHGVLPILLGVWFSMFGLGTWKYLCLWFFLFLFMFLSLVTVGLYSIYVRGFGVFLSGRGSSDFSLVAEKLSLYIYINEQISYCSCRDIDNNTMNWCKAYSKEWISMASFSRYVIVPLKKTNAISKMSIVLVGFSWLVFN